MDYTNYVVQSFDQPIEAEENNLANKATLLGVLVTLVVLVVAVWLRSPAIS